MTNQKYNLHINDRCRAVEHEVYLLGGNKVNQNILATVNTICFQYKNYNHNMKIIFECHHHDIQNIVEQMEQIQSQISVVYLLKFYFRDIDNLMLSEINRLGCLLEVRKEKDECYYAKYQYINTHQFLSNNNKILKNYSHSIAKFKKENIFSLQLKIKSLEQQILKFQEMTAQSDKSGDMLHKNEADEIAELKMKYQDTLKRLNNLRDSRLGKLQIKYWNYKKQI